MNWCERYQKNCDLAEEDQYKTGHCSYECIDCYEKEISYTSLEMEQPDFCR